MFFYTALFVASVITALVVLYLYKAVVSAGKAVYSMILPSAKNNRSSEIPTEQLATSINETLTPWGWKDRSAVVKTTSKHPEVTSGQTPWGWKGNSSKTRARAPRRSTGKNPVTGLDSFFGINGGEPGSNAERNPDVGWPYREEKFEFAGKAYKVTRKARPAKTNLSKSRKPWGW